MQTSQPIDHGVLSLPLAKRGDIDAQLDRYKAQQARDERAARREAAAAKKVLQARAKAAVLALTVEQLDAIAERINATRVQARKELHSMAHWTPGRALALVRVGEKGVA